MLLTMTILRYCNSRVSVYDGAGRHLHDLEGDWTVVHSLALYEQVRKKEEVFSLVELLSNYSGIDMLS